MARSLNLVVIPACTMTKSANVAPLLDARGALALGHSAGAPVYVPLVPDAIAALVEATLCQSPHMTEHGTNFGLFFLERRGMASGEVYLSVTGGPKGQPGAEGWQSLVLGAFGPLANGTRYEKKTGGGYVTLSKDADGAKVLDAINAMRAGRAPRMFTVPSVAGAKAQEPAKPAPQPVTEATPERPDREARAKARAQGKGATA